MADGSAERIRGRRILVVEDEFLIAEELRDALEDIGSRRGRARGDGRCGAGGIERSLEPLDGPRST
jgi:hypothetical protein